MVATLTTSYSAAQTLTLTLASRAWDNTYNPMRESNVVDNSSTLYDDVLVGGKVTDGATGGDSTNPGYRLLFYAYGSYDGTALAAGATGSDADLTPQGYARDLMAFLCFVPINPNLSLGPYFWGPVSIANVFGGIMPVKWGIAYSVYKSGNTTHSLDATAGNHEVKWTGIKYGLS